MSTMTDSTPQVRRFQRMQELDKKMREGKIIAQCGIDRDTQWRGLQDYNRAKDALSAIVGTMDLDEMVEYREWFLANPITPAFV